MRDQLNLLARKLRTSRDNIATEEATKTALVMPFIQNALGFDVFSLQDVIPEFVADVGLKKGEKVDFAILSESEVVILIECKKLNEPLSLENASQLYRYFNVTSARIGVLTNGNEYQFYTDLDEPNKMDSRPFITLSINDIDGTLVPELEKLTKSQFDLQSVLTAAEELKYVSAAKRVFAAEAKEVSRDMAGLVLGHIYNGRLTQRVREELTPLVQKGLQQFITDQVNLRLTTALGSDEDDSTASDSSAEPTDISEDPEDPLEASEVERQGFRIVQAIIAEHIGADRVKMRPAKSYCPIIIDDNNRKTVCRLHFNNSDKLHFGIMNEDKTETHHDLQKVEDLYLYAEQIMQVAKRFG